MSGIWRSLTCLWKIAPLAKRAKDIAAASVYVLSITAAIVGLLVFAHALGFI